MQRVFLHWAVALAAATTSAGALAQLSNAQVREMLESQDRGRLQQARLQQARLQAANEAGRRQPGIVYRNGEFWRRLPGLEAGRAVFEGRLDDVSDAEFRRFFLDYLARRSALCEPFVRSRPSVEFPQYTRTVWRRPDGVVESASGWSKSGAVWVERPFAVHYARYLEMPDIQSDMRIIGAALSTLSGRPVSDAAGLPAVIVGALQQQAALRNFSARGCGTPESAQTMDNLLRGAEGRPSAQAAGVRFEGADAASDPPPEPEDFITLTDACLDHHVGRRKDWCTCIGPKLDAGLDNAARRRYAADFESLNSALVRELGTERTLVRACIR